MRTRYALITMASVLVLVIGLPVGSVTGSVADARTRPACTITGTHRDERLHGTTGPDVICALRGEDWVYGRGGDDVIYGGLGPDHLLGQVGDDRVYGGMDDGLRGNRGDATRIHLVADRRRRPPTQGGAGQDAAGDQPDP